MKKHLLTLIVLLIGYISVLSAQEFKKPYDTNPFSTLSSHYFMLNQASIKTNWWQPDTVHYYDKDLYYTNRISYQYNTLGNIFKIIEQKYSEEDWRHKYIYDYEYENNNLISETVYSYSNNEFKNFMKTIFTYNEKNNVITKDVYAVKVNQWEKQNIYTYNYNENNLLESILIEILSPNGWTYSRQTRYTYDENGNTKTESYYYWNNEWLKQVNYIYSYDLNNIKINTIVQTRSGNNWKNDTFNTYSYAPNNKISSCVTQVWKEQSYWENSYLYLYEYNLSDLKTSYTTQSWNGSDWVDFERILFSYDNTTLTSEIEEIMKNNFWKKNYKKSYDYDDNNNCIKSTYYEFVYENWLISTTSSIEAYYNNMLSIYNSANTIYQLCQIELTYTNTPKPAGIEEVEQSTSEITIYPNPAKDNIYISVGNDEIRNVQIYNLTGKLVKQDKSNKININDLPVGMYIIKVETEDGNFIKKVIKD